MKVLTETATRLGREIGRREALDEALRYVETEARWQVELMKRDRDEEWEHSVQRLNVVAGCIRNARSAPSGAASDATSGVPRHPEVSEAPKAPQEPCGHPTCPCAPQEAKW